MAKILVSLVSEQTIPNVLFIKDNQDVDRYLFISTKAMEKKGKSQHIIDAAKGNVAENCKVLQVKEDSLRNIEEVLSGECADVTDEFLVNLTAGTKIMAIGVHDFFKNMDCTIVYIPIGKNHYRILHSKNEMMDKSINHKIGVQDYLTAYGITIKNPKKIRKTTFSESKTREFYDFYLQLDNSSLKLLDSLREYRGKKMKLSSASSGLTALLNECPVLECEGKEELLKNEIKYLTGEWFEEYIYFLLKSRMELDDTAIALGVQIQRRKVDNEFDIMFTFNNRLFVIECKTSIVDFQQERNILNDTLYKISALKKDFGLFVKPYLFTLSQGEQIKKNHLLRSDLFGINIVDRDDLRDSEKFDLLLSRI